MYLNRFTSARNSTRSIALVDSPPVTAGRILEVTVRACIPMFVLLPIELIVSIDSGLISVTSDKICSQGVWKKKRIYLGMI